MDNKIPPALNAVCKLGIVPLRREPKDSSEMVSQLLYGERCYLVSNGPEKLKNTPNWVEVHTHFAEYQGFIDQQQLKYVEVAETPEYIVQARIVEFNGQLLPMGAELTSSEITSDLVQALVENEEISLINVRKGRNAILSSALQFLNCPYLWGGRSALGLDCSGLTQIAYKVNGYELPRDSSQQAKVGKPIDLQNAQDGDLAFFSKPGKTTVSHVGLVIREESSTKIIHASSWVRVDDLTEEGIIRDDGICSHELLHIQNVISDD